MLLACLIVASVGLCLGDADEVVDERLALLEKKMLGLEEENKYLRLDLLMCFIDTYVADSVQNKVDEDL